jgi:hypothetical protein
MRASFSKIGIGASGVSPRASANRDHLAAASGQDGTGQERIDSDAVAGALVGERFRQRRDERVDRADSTERGGRRRRHHRDRRLAESFSASLKKERIKKRIYHNRDQVIAEVSDYIDSF